MSSHAALSAASDDRKARLAKLKSLKRKQPTEEPEPEAGADLELDTTPAPAPPLQQLTDTTTDTSSPIPPTNDVARLHLSGRNYDPSTKGPKLGFEAPPTLALDKPTLEQHAADLEDKSKRQAAVDAQDAAAKGIDLFKLQPKKPNWDLKREFNLKMEVLGVRTENAIARLVRERLAERKREAEAVRGITGDGGGGGGKIGDGDADGEGMLDGAAIVEGMRLREREEEEENRREREAEAEEFGMA